MTPTRLRNEQITSEAAVAGDVLTADGSGGADWEAPAASAGAFTDLSDVPASYSGQGGKAVIVKLTEDGLEFGAAPSTGLWEPVTNGDDASPEMLFVAGDIVMVEV